MYFFGRPNFRLSDRFMFFLLFANVFKEFHRTTNKQTNLLIIELKFLLIMRLPQVLEYFYLQVYIKDDDQNKNKLGIGNLKKDRKPENKGRAQIRKRLRSPGIDSKESIPPAYVACSGLVYDNPIQAGLAPYMFTNSGLGKKQKKSRPF